MFTNVRQLRVFIAGQLRYCREAQIVWYSDGFFFFFLKSTIHCRRVIVGKPTLCGTAVVFYPVFPKDDNDEREWKKENQRAPFIATLLLSGSGDCVARRFFIRFIFPIISYLYHKGDGATISQNTGPSLNSRFDCAASLRRSSWRHVHKTSWGCWLTSGVRFIMLLSHLSLF